MSKWRLTRSDVLVLIIILVAVGIVVWLTSAIPAAINIFNTGGDNLFIGMPWI